MQVHCKHCNGKRAVAQAQPFTTKGGRPGIKGRCSSCHGGVSTFISKADAQKMGSGFFSDLGSFAGRALGGVVGRALPF
jgi:hypothetical protein